MKLLSGCTRFSLMTGAIDAPYGGRHTHSNLSAARESYPAMRSS
jgi:hypothetical protein